MDFLLKAFLMFFLPPPLFSAQKRQRLVVKSLRYMWPRFDDLNTLIPHAQWYWRVAVLVFGTRSFITSSLSQCLFSFYFYLNFRSNSVTSPFGPVMGIMWNTLAFVSLLTRSLTFQLYAEGFSLFIHFSLFVSSLMNTIHVLYIPPTQSFKKSVQVFKKVCLYVDRSPESSTPTWTTHPQPHKIWPLSLLHLSYP